MAAKDTTPDPLPCLYHEPVEGFAPDYVSIPQPDERALWAVRCPYCYASGPVAQYFDDAVHLWNSGCNKAREPVNDPAAMSLLIANEQE